jgi:tetratricopeptide (TPR) repeat protein
MYKPAPSPLEEAISFIKANKHAAALPLLEEIARKQPDEPEVFPWLAQCYLQTDRLAEGRTALDTALKLKLPGKLTAPVVLSFAQYYENRDDYAEAERLFGSAQTAVPAKLLASGQALLYLRWSDANSNDGQTLDAIKHLKVAYALLPDGDSAKLPIPQKISGLYRELAAVAETEHNDYAKASSLLTESLTWCNEPATRMALGSLYVRMNKLQNAIENYQAVCQLDPNNLEARHHLVDLHLQSNDLKGAQQALLELTEKERSVENFQTLADVNLKLLDYAGAVRALEDANELSPQDLDLLTRLYEALNAWNAQLTKDGKTDQAMAVKGHADRVGEMLASLQQESDLADGEQGGGVPPIGLVASRIWLAKGSFTPEAEIRFKNISGKPVNDLTVSMVFFDRTTRHKNGTVTVNAASPAHPLLPDAVQSAYFSCPQIVKSEHQLAVIVLWKGRFLQELPVVKER